MPHPTSVPACHTPGIQFTRIAVQAASSTRMQPMLNHSLCICAVPIQAATWHLLTCLYGCDQPAAGTGGPEVLGVGGRRIARQILADKVGASPQLARYVCND